MDLLIFGQFFVFNLLASLFSVAYWSCLPRHLVRVAVIRPLTSISSQFGWGWYLIWWWITRHLGGQFMKVIWTESACVPGWKLYMRVCPDWNLLGISMGIIFSHLSWRLVARSSSTLTDSRGLEILWREIDKTAEPKYRLVNQMVEHIEDPLLSGPCKSIKNWDIHRLMFCDAVAPL